MSTDTPLDMLEEKPRTTTEAIDLIMADIGPAASAAFSHDPGKPMRIARNMATVLQILDREVEMLSGQLAEIMLRLEAVASQTDQGANLKIGPGAKRKRG